MGGHGMHQVGLAEPDAAVQKERVEGNGRRIGDATRSGVGQLVRLADDEVLEREAGIERRAELVESAARRRRARRRAGTCGRFGDVGVADRFRCPLHDRDLDDAHRTHFLGPQETQALGKMVAHPVPHETRGRPDGELFLGLGD